MKRNEVPGDCGVEVKEQEWGLSLQGEEVLHCRLTWPELSGAGRGVRAINRYYRRVAAAWRERWEKEVYLYACLEFADRRAQGRPFRIWQASVETHITLHEMELLSLWQEGTERHGYGRPLKLRRGDTWSVRDGAPRTLGSFFPRHRWKRQVLAQVEEAVQARLAGGESLLDPDCVTRLRRGFAPERFYLTGEGAQVFYPMYALAPGGEGIPSFSISLP